MPFCPYCKEIVGNNVTECPSCGMSWSASDQPQAPPAPRIVNEQPLPPQQPQYQAPPQQPAYQQQPQYQPPPQQYQQPPPQPQYQQPPPQYQQAPPQPYPQPYAQAPYPPQRPRKKVGGGSMALAMIGGIFGMLCAMMVFYTEALGVSDISNMFDNLPNDYLYAWLIPLSGLMAFVFAIIGFGAQSKAMGTLTGLCGLAMLVLPVVWAYHMASDIGISIVDVFYSSNSGFGFSMTMIFIGGLSAMLGGLMAMAGGFGLARRIPKKRPAAPQQYYR